MLSRPAYPPEWLHRPPDQSPGAGPLWLHEIKHDRIETMDANQACYFVALCEERSFTRAGRRCGIAQSSMTNAIKALEREFGGPLFFRKPEIALTALGQAVHPYLLRIAEAAELAHAAAKQVRRGRQTAA